METLSQIEIKNADALFISCTALPVLNIIDKLEKNKISHNLDNKTYFYWMSSSAFELALSEFPSIRDKFHFCGPGNTYNEIKNILGKDSKNLFIELSYKDWKSNILSSTK